MVLGKQGVEQVIHVLSFLNVWETELRRETKVGDLIQSTLQLTLGQASLGHLLNASSSPVGCFLSKVELSVT